MDVSIICAAVVSSRPAIHDPVTDASTAGQPPRAIDTNVSATPSCNRFAFVVALSLSGKDAETTKMYQRVLVTTFVSAV